MKYYWAVQMAQLIKYHLTCEIPLWIGLEVAYCDPLSIDNILWLRPSDHKSLSNPITLHSLTICVRLKQPSGLLSSHMPFLCFLHNPWFYPAYVSPTSFQAWSDLNLTRLHHLTTPTVMKTYQTLRDQSTLQSSDLFKYTVFKLNTSCH